MLVNRFRFLLSGVVCLLAMNAFADEKLKGIACRSVHLQFPAAEGTAFYNEITVQDSAPGTYFAVCGWNKGYYGIQELANGKKLLIFSVWDSPKNDPNAVKDADRVKLLHKDEKLRVGRFGGEGSGGQSFYDYDWKVGETYRFLVRSKVDDKRTEYSGYFFHPEEKAWKHLVTFSTITGGLNMRGYYSFVEDFKRDKVSSTKIRKATYGNTWIYSTDNKWVLASRAQFTADSNPVTNINAAVVKNRFVLATGGDTENTGTKLRANMELTAEATTQAPNDLPKP